MSTMNISLPDEMKNWVESEVQQGGFASASEYFRQLVREAKAHKETQAHDARLEALLIESIESGEGQPVTAQWWADLRAQMEKDLGHRKAQ